jgi:hypothetical protein
MASEKAVSLRDRRKPGHGWFDNEIYDVFGDELRQDGISVYMTLARLCYGVSVTMSLREMAGHARMGKDTFGRNLKRVIALGLVIERKGATALSASTYELVDVKELAAQYMRDAMRRKSVANRESVSGRDMRNMPTLVQLITDSAHKHIQGMEDKVDALCLSVRQEENRVEVGEKKICVEEFATDLSQNEGNFETDLSQAKRHPHRQDTRHKTQDNTPLPPRGESCDAEVRVPGEVSACAEVQWVMRELNLTDKRMAPVIEQALRMRREKTGAPGFMPIAEMLVNNWFRFLTEGNLMKYPVGLKKFIERGWWVGDLSWPYDQKMLSDHNRARQAS